MFCSQLTCCIQALLESEVARCEPRQVQVQVCVTTVHSRLQCALPAMTHKLLLCQASCVRGLALPNTWRTCDAPPNLHPHVQVEAGEIPQYALQRELYEELGVEVRACIQRLSVTDRCGCISPEQADAAVHCSLQICALLLLPGSWLAASLMPPKCLLSLHRWQVEEGALQALTFVSHRYWGFPHNFIALLFGA